MSASLKVGLFCSCVALYATLSTARHVSKDMDQSLSIQCMEAVPMIGDVPHPTNCYKFYSCSTAAPGSTIPTVPLERDCALGANGMPLFYDFRNCRCHHDNSVCFDGIADRADFFTCARAYNASETVTLGAAVPLPLL